MSDRKKKFSPTLYKRDNPVSMTRRIQNARPCVEKMQFIFFVPLNEELEGTSLSYSSSNINEIEQRLNSDITKIYNWSTKWLVDFNPQKTKCMLFSTNQGNIKPQILFNNEDVEFVVNHKHLGVTFSSNCKWHCHIQNILKSTSGQLSMLRKLNLTGKISKKYILLI